MALPPLLSKTLTATLRYSLRFDYPLTKKELWFWQINTHFSQAHLVHLSLPQFRSYYYLPGFRHTALLRQNRLRTSHTLLHSALPLLHQISRFPTVLAVYITGALAMSNSPADDDIDIMIITQPHTLWFTRFVIDIYLKLFHLRRSHSHTSGAICDNLWLDISHLSLPHKNLYTAHELLQAKLTFGNPAITQQLLIANSWVGDYLPIAYKESLKKVSRLPANYLITQLLSILLYIPNFLLYICQYLYMRSKITNETISLHQAFFHPRRYL